MTRRMTHKGNRLRFFGCGIVFVLLGSFFRFFGLGQCRPLPILFAAFCTCQRGISMRLAICYTCKRAFCMLFAVFCTCKRPFPMLFAVFCVCQGASRMRSLQDVVLVKMHLACYLRYVVLTNLHSACFCQCFAYNRIWMQRNWKRNIYKATNHCSNIILK